MDYSFLGAKYKFLSNAEPKSPSLLGVGCTLDKFSSSVVLTLVSLQSTSLLLVYYLITACHFHRF